MNLDSYLINSFELENLNSLWHHFIYLCLTYFANCNFSFEFHYMLFYYPKLHSKKRMLDFYLQICCLFLNFYCLSKNLYWQHDCYLFHSLRLFKMLSNLVALSQHSNNYLVLFIIEFYNELLLKIVREFILQRVYHLFTFYLIYYENFMMLLNYYFLKFCFINVHFWLTMKILN